MWARQSKLLAADTWISDSFGRAVGISGDGNTAVVSSYNAYDRGAFYTFVRNGTDWIAQPKVRPLDAPTTFGYAMALSGDGSTVLVGAAGKAAYVFIRSGTDTWTQQTQLPVSGISEMFASLVALSEDGNTALVASPYTWYCLATDYVYVYTRNAARWSYQTNLSVLRAGQGPIPIALSGDGNTAIIRFSHPDIANPVFVYSSSPFVPTPSPTPTYTPTPFGTDMLGVYKDGLWYLRTYNNQGLPDITAAFGGDPSDLPVAGDWNGDKVDTIGVYRSSTGFFYLSDSNTTPSVAYTVLFGNPGDTPFSGRWTANMTGSGIGVYRNSNGILYQRKSLTSGVNDFFAIYGNPGDQAVAGDWDGNGFDSIGIYRSSNRMWYLTNNSTPSGVVFSDISFLMDYPITSPIAGDWDGDGIATVGGLDTNRTFILRLTNANSSLYNSFYFGPADGKPVAGKWVAGSRPPVANVIHPITGAAGNNSNDNGRTD